MKNKIKIIVCCHKPGRYLNNDVYVPIQCGKENHKDVELGIQGDNEGENISSKNGSYCELTALYWAWKNLKDVDYIGLCHYRRYFNFKKKSLWYLREAECIQEDKLNDYSLFDIKQIMLDCDVVLPASRPLPYSLIETHILNHGFINFCILEHVILKLYPEYEKSLFHVFYHSFDVPQRNMFVMKKELFDEYAQWLFHILFEVEKLVKPSQYLYEQRLFGFMGEMLLPLFCYHNKLSVKRKQLLFVTGDKTPSVIRTFSVNILKRLRFLLNTAFRKKAYSEEYLDLLEAEGVLYRKVL